MEAPKPISLITPENNISFSFKKDFKLSHEKTEYIIEVGKTSTQEKLGLKLKESSSNVYYSTYFNLEELQNVSKYFRCFDNINEAITSIQDIFEEKKCSLKIENNNVFLMIKVPKIGKGEDLIQLQLNKCSLSLHEICDNLSKEIINLKNKIKVLENYKNILIKEINELKNENKKKDLILNEIIQWKKSIENKEKEEKNKIYKIDNKILINKEEIDFISNRLKEIYYFRNKNLSYELIYRGTRDGATAELFHKKVDGVSKTITIIKTIKGLKFGGYIERKWNDKDNWIKDDENCFIFSLDLRKIYNPIKGKDKYYLGKCYGPDFSEFGLFLNLFDKSSTNLLTRDSANKYFTMFNSDYEINGGEKEFQAEEIEVFQIISN